MLEKLLVYFHKLWGSLQREWLRKLWIEQARSHQHWQRVLRATRSHLFNASEGKINIIKQALLNSTLLLMLMLICRWKQLLNLTYLCTDENSTLLLLMLIYRWNVTGICKWQQALNHLAVLVNRVKFQWYLFLYLMFHFILNHTMRALACKKIAFRSIFGVNEKT